MTATTQNKPSSPIVQQTQIMGILNTTPDSFSDGGKWQNTDKAIDHALQMIEDGADILDIGGESTRPGSLPVSEKEEHRRTIPIIKALRKKTDIPISIDTTKSQVAQAALDAGATLINDISALTFDRKMKEIAAHYACPIILMHTPGNPQTMQQQTTYKDVLQSVSDHLTQQISEAQDAGILKENIIIDPGIGFGKTCEQNLALLRDIKTLKKSGYPILIGASRKRIIGDVLNVPVEERLEGSLAISAWATIQGAAIIRVHDVKENHRTIRMIEAIMAAEKSTRI